MNSFKKIVFILLLLVAYNNKSIGQLRYFLKPFETKEKKFIALMEENSRKQQEMIQKFEDEKTYNDFKRKLKSERKTEIDISGLYRSRNEFLEFGRSNSLEAVLKKEVQKSLSKVTGQLEDVKSTGTFRRASFPIQQLTLGKIEEERSSLKKVSKAEVYISIPKTLEEFKNIFNEPNNSQFKNAKKIRETVKNEPNPKVHFLNNSDAFMNEIFHSTESTPIILIGHNEGGEFCFPDGSKKKFEKIDSIANVAKRTIIYLSCNSKLFTNNLATNYYLTYSDGIALTNRINNALTGNNYETTSIKKMEIILNNIIETYGKEKKQKRKYRIATSSIALSGIGYTLYEIKQGDNK